MCIYLVQSKIKFVEQLCSRNDYLFPNPSAGITCILVQSSDSQWIRISLRDVLGREIKEVFNGMAPSGESRYFTDVNTLSAGIYHVVSEYQKGSSQYKLLVK